MHGSFRALEAALIVGVRDRERSERVLAVALVEHGLALSVIDESRLVHAAAEEELSTVWKSVTGIARMKALREGARAEVARAAEGVSLALSRAGLAATQVVKSRHSVSETSAAEEAIRRVLRGKREEARRVRLLRAEEDLE
ncbi:MAG: hypothetical protein ACJAYU_002901 [Bradymonadia bacterium]|jgi:hypothetical protein